MSSCFSNLLLFWLAFFFWKQIGISSFTASDIFGYSIFLHFSISSLQVVLAHFSMICSGDRTLNAVFIYFERFFPFILFGGEGTELVAIIDIGSPKGTTIELGGGRTNEAELGSIGKGIDVPGNLVITPGNAGRLGKPKPMKGSPITPIGIGPIGIPIPVPIIEGKVEGGICLKMGIFMFRGVLLVILLDGCGPCLLGTTNDLFGILIPAIGLPTIWLALSLPALRSFLLYDLSMDYSEGIPCWNWIA